MTRPTELPAPPAEDVGHWPGLNSAVVSPVSVVCAFIVLSGPVTPIGEDR